MNEQKLLKIKVLIKKQKESYKPKEMILVQITLHHFQKIQEKKIYDVVAIRESLGRQILGNALSGPDSKASDLWSSPRNAPSSRKGSEWP